MRVQSTKKKAFKIKTQSEIKSNNFENVDPFLHQLVSKELKQRLEDIS